MATTCLLDSTVIVDGVNDEAERTEAFLESLEFYLVTQDVAKYAGELYRAWRQQGLTLALPDLTVAAVAVRNGLMLATDNPKDFPMPELRLYSFP
jgi:predicted nucleic acid-binding protein